MWYSCYFFRDFRVRSIVKLVHIAPASWANSRSARRGRVRIGATNRPGDSEASAHVRDHDHSGDILHGVHPGDHHQAAGEDAQRQDS